MNKLKMHTITKIFAVIMATVGINLLNAATVADLANNVLGVFDELMRLLTGAAYLAGFGFIIGAVFKFKKHRDNPNQVPMGTPIAMLGVGAALVFLPTLIGVSGETIFGTSGEAGTIGGFDSLS